MYSLDDTKRTQVKVVCHFSIDFRSILIEKVFISKPRMEFTKFRDPTALRSKKDSTDNGRANPKIGKEKSKKNKKSFKTNAYSSQKNGPNSKKPVHNRQSKPDVVRTRSALPLNPADFSANWRQISNLIQKQAISVAVSPVPKPLKEDSKEKKYRKEVVSEKPSNIRVDAQPTAENKSKLKRKLKREKAKLGRKSGARKPDAKKQKKATTEDEGPANQKDKPMPGNRNSSQINKKKVLWFEVDNIYLDRVVNAGGEAVPASEEHLIKRNSPTGLTPTIAIDCEMVGVGVSKRSALARVSIVNQFGYCIYDKYVKPEEEITDYRTFVSGIRPRDLASGDHIDVVRQEVADLFRGRIVVGHGINNDLKALFLRHPKRDIRDTSHYFRRHFSGHTPSLKRLTETLLNLKVQSGEHSSVEDAQATMRLYTMYKKEWETSLGVKSKQKHNSQSNKQLVDPQTDPKME